MRTMTMMGVLFMMPQVTSIRRTQRDFRFGEQPRFKYSVVVYIASVLPSVEKDLQSCLLRIRFLHNSCVKSKIWKNCFMSRWAVECASTADTLLSALRRLPLDFSSLYLCISPCLDSSDNVSHVCLTLCYQRLVMRVFDGEAFSLFTVFMTKNVSQNIWTKSFLPPRECSTIKMSKFWYHWINCVFYDVFTTRYTQSTSILARFDMNFCLFFTLEWWRNEGNSLPKFMNLFSVSRS